MRRLSSLDSGTTRLESGKTPQQLVISDLMHRRVSRGSLRLSDCSFCVPHGMWGMHTDDRTPPVYVSQSYR